MNINTNSQYMDKQIMDLSDSHDAANNSSDFIDFMNRPAEKKDDIVASYDFMPIRPVSGSSFPPPPANRSSIYNSAEDDAPPRTWNSFDSKANASSIRNYSSLDADEPAKFNLGKNHKPVNTQLDASLVSEIDRTMKKYADNLMHAIDGMSARLTQLETRNRNLEHLMDDMKLSVGNTHGSTEGKMRQLENILREVQTTVQDIKDKQDIVEAQLQISTLHLPKTGQVEHQNTAHTESTQPVPPAYQQFSTVSPTLNAPPPPPPQQNFQPQAQIPNQFPNQFPQNQVPSVPQQGSYFSPSGQNPENLSQQYQVPENPSQQYQVPPNQPQPHNPPPLPPQHQYQPPPQTPYSQPAPPSQPHQSFPPLNPAPPQPPLGHHPEELPPYPPLQTYPLGIRPSLPHPSNPPPQQFYGPSPNMYEPPSSRPGPGYSGHGEPYPYSGSPRKPQSSQFTAQSGGSGYPQLPTARILPQALPTASGIGGGSGSGNKVPIDDVIDRVTNMGFPRDQVRATVRKLTENGQAVDLNVVLDKLMNEW